MKTIFSLLFLMVSMVGFCQNKYQEAMANAIQLMNSAANTEDFQNCANTFERISMNETKEWLPLYYAAHCYIIKSFQEPDNAKKDPILDKAQAFLDKAFKLAPEESELFALQAFLYPSRMTVDPMTRGMQYIGLLNQSIEKAIQLNPENPRAYYLKAVITLNMPEAMGGGTVAAKPLLETARAKFENFTPATPLYPNWGKEINQAELDKL
jgi:hypothetical protein